MVIVAVRELVFRSKIQAAAERLGVPVRFAPRTGSLEEAVAEGGGTLLVDLTQPGVLDEVRAVKRAHSVHVVGFLGHLQTALMQDASEAGVDEVLPRGAFVNRIDDLLRAGSDACVGTGSRSS